MRLGVVFPQTEIGSDPIVIRDYAQAAERAGYHHLLAFDHVLGGKPDRFHAEASPPYTDESPFHEPFVLFGYLAACTRPGAGDWCRHPSAAADRAASPSRPRRSNPERGAPASGSRHSAGTTPEYEALREHFQTRGGAHRADPGPAEALDGES